MSITEFLSTVGRHFRIGTMMSRNSVQSRMDSEAGISFSEFSYQALQAYDWLHLLRRFKCRFQVKYCVWCLFKSLAINETFRYDSR